MSKFRQIVISYVLALTCAGSMPLWLHHLISHSTETSLSGVAELSCHDCGFCKHRAATKTGEADSTTEKSIAEVSGQSNCNNCLLCFQLSQAVAKSNCVACETSSPIVLGDFLFGISNSNAEAYRTLGPRGPPSVTEC